jgi:predicted nucleotidyltransferase component of viral defense system
MNRDTIYFKQVQLLIRVLPLVATEQCFALKGGTAINLFIRDLPRLSVDIDLVYLPMYERELALTNIREALGRISKLIEKTIRGVSVQNTHEQSEALRLIVSDGAVRIKVELSPVIRGTIFSEKVLPVSKSVEDNFGFAEIQVVSIPDLYAGKICAALDRQHPRDLFDVKLLFENEGFTEDLRKAFIIFLISHQRPMSELLRPNLKELRSVYENEFYQMTQIDIGLDELIKTRELLIKTIHTDLSDEEKKFLISFKSKEPRWELLGMEKIETVQELPSVKWKMKNLMQMPEKKHAAALEKLIQILDFHTYP